MSIKPTVGRVVWYRKGTHEDLATIGDQPAAAIITGVWSDTCVNLVVFDANGDRHGRTSVLLLDENMERPLGTFCEWMPYQKGQAAKTEAVEEALNRSIRDQIIEEAAAWDRAGNKKWGRNQAIAASVGCKPPYVTKILAQAAAGTLPQRRRTR